MVAKINIDFSISNIVRTLLPEINKDSNKRFGYGVGKRKTALYIRIRMQKSYHGYLEDGNTLSGYKDRTVCDYLHYIFSGNVSVWFAATNSPFLDTDPSKYKNTSNHDSCWSSDGLRDISRIYFEQCEKVQDHLPENLKVAPAYVSDFSLLEKVSLVEITINSSEGNRYGYDLTSLKRSNLKLTVGE